MAKESSNSGGIGFFGLLTILFIGLKLTGHIDWSWWLVLSPVLGILSIVIVSILFLVAIKYLESK